MSSGCYHPENLFPVANHRDPEVTGVAEANSTLSQDFNLVPHPGDKKSERPIYFPNSASQTLVKFAVKLPVNCPTVNS
jgi:hypothetical protein